MPLHPDSDGVSLSQAAPGEVRWSFLTWLTRAAAFVWIGGGHAVNGSTSKGAPGTRMFLRVSRTSDTLVAVVALFGVFVALNLKQMPEGVDEFLQLRVTLKNVLLLVGFVSLWRVMFASLGLYDRQRLESGRSETARVMIATTLTSVGALAFPLTSTTGAFRFEVLPVFWAVATLGVLVSRYGLRRLCAPHAPPVKQVLIVGSGPRALRVYQEVCGPDRKGSRFLGFVDSNDQIGEEASPYLIGRLDQLESLLMHQTVDEVLITLPTRSHYAEIERAIQVCERVGVSARYLADIFQRDATVRAGSSNRYLKPVVATVPEDYRRVIKRSMDFVGALLGLMVLSPVLLIIAGLIKATSRGPVIFAQERYGLSKRRFKMYKFRTMVAEAEKLQAGLEQLNEASGPVFKIRLDPRITPIGRVLRRTSLDELPQLFNVLEGEMSLVGPRPLPVRDVIRFPEAALMRRFSVPPGLTCLWQISGRSDLEFDEWVRLDLSYIDRWSLSLDCQILLKTFPALVKGTGAA